MASSPQYGELAKALVEVQGQLTAVKKDNTADAGQYSYRYADLASVWDVVRPLLKENGIAVIQMPEDVVDGQTVRLKTMLLHTSGEWITSTLPMPFGQTSAQAVGSALTYARRYALCAMLGVATEDDDGAEAEKGATRPAARTGSVDGVVSVTGVDKKPTKNGGMRFMVHFSDGESFSTFNEEIGALALEVNGTGEAVDYSTETRGKWVNLGSLTRVAPDPARQQATAKELADVAADAFGEPPHPADEPMPFETV